MMCSKAKLKIEETLRKVLIDIDYRPNFKFYRELAEKVALIEKYIPVTFTLIKIRETKKGVHIYFKIKPEYEITPYDIIIFQLILGSDWRRELFNMRRAMEWWQNDGLEGLSTHWNVLYDIKFEGRKIVSYEYKSEYTDYAEKVFLENLDKYRKEFICKKGDRRGDKTW